jgi:hypothetical protein
MRTLLHVLLACSLFLFAVPTDLYAQDRTLSGTVIADDSKTALSGVTIRIKGTRRITQTDANGKFSIKVSTGEIVQISSVGYG